MQVILNNLKRDYPHAYGFLMMNLELRDYLFEAAELKAIQSEEKRIWVARRNELRELCRCLEDTFHIFNGDNSNG